jgi:hypothetical protein
MGKNELEGDLERRKLFSGKMKVEVGQLSVPAG